MTQNILGEGAFDWNNTAYKILLSAAESNGSLSITDSVSQPGDGPPRHIHHDADEAFVVLSGDVTFWLEGTLHKVGPGGAIMVPRGKEHTFHISSDRPSRHLVILTPGGFEGFFREMADGNYAIPANMQQITQIAEKYHLTFTGPPLSPEEIEE